MNIEKKNPNRRKLSLNRETLRTLSAERLGKVAGGISIGGCGTVSCGGGCYSMTCASGSTVESFVDGASLGPDLCIV